MRERGELLGPEWALLVAVMPGPASVQEISQRTGQAHLEVWLLFARLEARGLVQGQPSEAGGLDTGRLYAVTDRGRTALRENSA